MSIFEKLFGHPADNIAVLTSAEPLTYGQLRSDVARAAAFLKSNGIGPGTTVGIYTGSFRESDEYLNWIAHLAAIYVGARHASVHDARFLQSLSSLATVDAIIGEMPAGDSVPTDIRVVPFVLDEMPAAKETASKEDRAERLNLTSGTTGTPKILRWDGAMIAARVDQLSDLGLIDSDTRLQSLLAPRTTAGFRYPLAVWCAGGAVLLQRSAGDTKLPVGESTLCICSPFQLQRMMAMKARWPNRDRRTIVALGGRVPPRLGDWVVANLATKAIISYGSTETGNVAHGDAQIADRHPGAVGWVREGVEVQIVDAQGEPVERGTTGRLRFKTPLMVLPQGQELSEGGWFEPGDMGVLFEDGLLAIAGRGTDVINVGGLKLSAVDLESKLVGIDGIEDAAITVVRSPKGDALALAVVAAKGARPDDLLPRIKPLMSQGLTFFLLLVNAIPRNSMGKVDRATLSRQLMQRRQQAMKVLKRQHA